MPKKRLTVAQKAKGKLEKVRDKDLTRSTPKPLPAGIKDGVAKVSRCFFESYQDDTPISWQKNEQYFLLSGTIISPEEYKGRNVERRIAFCDQTNKNGDVYRTTEQNLANVIGEFQKLGVDTKNMEPEDLEPTCETLVESAPVFKFSTVQGTKKPNSDEHYVNIYFNGLVDEDEEVEIEEEDDEYEDVEEEEVEDEVEDEEEDEEVEEEADDEEDEEEDEPSTEDIFLYKPPKRRKNVECEVVKVNKKNKTCTLKNLETDTLYQDVSWEELKDVTE